MTMWRRAGFPRPGGGAWLGLVLWLWALAMPCWGQVTTNETLYRQFRVWEKAIREGEAKGVIAEIEGRGSRMAKRGEPVLEGAGWLYNWGYLTALTKAWAEQWRGRTVDAYRTLKNAEGLRPVTVPPAPQDYHYWQWFLATGDACMELTRLQDAAWYFRQVRQNVSTNDGHYWKATVSLAAALNRQGRLNEAAALYDEVIQTRPDQPAEVWKDYVELLFDAGYFDEGVEAILVGAEEHGLSERQAEMDFFAQRACKYWSFFSDEQVVRWYDLLGRLLDRTPLVRNTEDFLAYLINTRKILEKACPELVGLGRNELAALQERAEREPLPKSKGLPRCTGGVDREAGGASGTDQEEATGHSREPSKAIRPVQLAIEDDVNRALIQSLEAKRRGAGEVGSWQKLLDTYSTNDLHEVVVDGMSALFHAYATLGASYSYASKPVEAKGWLLKALDEAKAQDGFNAMRMADVLITMGDVHLNSWVMEPTEAARYLDWARTAAKGYRKEEYLALAGLAGVALQAEDDGVDRRRILLQEILAKYGCLPRRNIYERLARDCYRIGRFREGFKAYEEGFKRANLKENPEYDHLVEGLVMTRSLHTASELDRLRRIFRRGMLRYPATIQQAASIARMMELSEAPWIRQHEELARLEESGAYASDESWTVITNACVQNPSVRAGLLHVRAELARRTSLDGALDWSGWRLAWGQVRVEFTSKETVAPTDSGGDVAAYGLLLELLLPQLAVLSDEDYAAVAELLQNDAQRLSHEQFDELSDAFSVDDPETEFRLHLARMKGMKNTSPRTPSFQRLVALQGQMDTSLQRELIDLLRSKRDQAHDAGLKREWEPLLKNCGVAP